MSKARDKKVEAVRKLEEKVKRAKAVVLADYRGLTHKQLETLKKTLKTVEAELVVTKNTLLKRAMENGKWKMENPIDGPTATLFAFSDPIAPLRELAKTIKTLKLPVIKLGILEGRTFSAEQILQIANFPSREILIAQLVGGMKAPIYGLHRALTWNIQRLVLTLKAIENKK